MLGSVIIWVKIIESSKTTVLILFPEIMNSTTGNIYSRYGLIYHCLLTKDSNNFTGDYLTGTINVYNKF